MFLTLLIITLINIEAFVFAAYIQPEPFALKVLRVSRARPSHRATLPVNRNDRPAVVDITGYRRWFT